MQVKKIIKPAPTIKFSTIILLGLLLIYVSYQNIKALQTYDIDRLRSIDFIVGLICNFLLAYLLFSFIRLRLVLIITDNKISFKLSPYHLKYRDIKKEDIKSIKIKGKQFHIGIGFKGTIDYAVGSGCCLQIELSNGKKYLLSTGCSKLKIIDLIDKFGYINVESIKISKV